MAGLVARSKGALAGLITGDGRFEHAIEEARRQEAVIVAIAARQLAQIVARPQKHVAFGDNDP